MDGYSNFSNKNNETDKQMFPNNPITQSRFAWSLIDSRDSHRWIMLFTKNLHEVSKTTLANVLKYFWKSYFKLVSKHFSNFGLKLFSKFHEGK